MKVSVLEGNTPMKDAIKLQRLKQLLAHMMDQEGDFIAEASTVKVRGAVVFKTCITGVLSMIMSRYARSAHFNKRLWLMA